MNELVQEKKAYIKDTKRTGMAMHAAFLTNKDKPDAPT